VSFLLQQEAGLQLPRRLQIEFSGIVQKISDTTGREVKSREIVELFEREYFAVNTPFEFHHSTLSENADQVEITINSQFREQPVVLTGRGNGPIDAAAHAISQHIGCEVSVVDYHEHAVGEGSNVSAVSYIEMKIDQGKPIFGVGKDHNIIVAALKALLNGINRFYRE
jgi:2-isopropylmalate synthase